MVAIQNAKHPARTHYMLLQCLLISLLLPGVRLHADGDAKSIDGKGKTPAQPEWGNLTGQFLYDGIPAQLPAKQVAGRQATNESLVIDSKTQGIANVCIWLFRDRDQGPLAVHPAIAELPITPAMINITESGFQPRVMFALTSEWIQFQSLVAHGSNVNLTLLRNPARNFLIPPHGRVNLEVQQEESIPVSVASNIHPQYRSFLIVKSHPYVAISSHDGRFHINNLPTGTHTFQVWHELAGFVSEATVNKEAATWKRGRFTFEIKRGENSLGEIKLKPALFKP